jgi:hypothetical protein
MHDMFRFLFKDKKKKKRKNGIVVGWGAGECQVHCEKTSVVWCHVWLFLFLGTNFFFSICDRNSIMDVRFGSKVFFFSGIII